MPTVLRNAEFRIGFQSTAEYEELSDADKQDFKGKVEAEIKNRIWQTDLNNFDSSYQIDVDSVTGHATEAVITAKVDTILGALKDKAGVNPANIARATDAGVRYVVWNNKRECIHDYNLDYNAPANWFVQATYGTVNVEARLYGSIFWNWDIT